MTDRRKGYSEQNKQAWDSLYGQAEDSVWGSEPIPFVEEFIGGLELPLNESSVLLDAAAGEGRHLPLLLRLPGRVYASDASANAIRRMERIPGEFEIVRCGLESMPFADECFDFMTLIDTVETLPNAAEVLGELYRMLKPGGMLLCNIPGREDGISSEAMEGTGMSGADSYLYQGTYFYRFYREDEALGLVRRKGFKVLRNEIRSWTENPHPGFRDHRHTHTSRVFLLAKPSKTTLAV